MSTSDTSLGVINSMSEEMLESLKDSSGKVPSLANQLIMTDDEVDVNNIDTLSATVLYDKNSSDSAINWGYTSGITSGITVSNKNFSGYQRLKVEAVVNTVIRLFYEVDIGSYGGAYTINYDNNNVLFSVSYCDLTTFVHTRAGYGTTTLYSNADYAVVKIWGVK